MVPGTRRFLPFVQERLEKSSLHKNKEKLNQKACSRAVCYYWQYRYMNIFFQHYHTNTCLFIPGTLSLLHYNCLKYFATNWTGWLTQVTGNTKYTPKRFIFDPDKSLYLHSHSKIWRSRKVGTVLASTATGINTCEITISQSTSRNMCDTHKKYYLCSNQRRFLK